MSRGINRIPVELRRRLEFVHDISVGGQSQVMLTRRRSATRPEDRVLKLYHVGIEPDREVLERLVQNPSASVVRIYEYGWLESERCWYELQEFIRDGSLTTLLARRPGPQDENFVRAILMQLAAGLGFLGGQRITHRDLKPDNVLVRDAGPPLLALADLGTASNMGGRSQRFTGVERTAAYAPPEAGAGEVSFASDWWSLGMILVELLTGRHPLQSADGQFPSANEISNLLGRTPPDRWADGVPDAWSDICRGLLRGQPRHRWGADQVLQWLEGGSPTVEGESRGPVDYAPFHFAAVSQPLSNLRDIARALSNHWAAALEVIGRNRLTDWVRNELQNAELAQRLVDISMGYEEADLRLFHSIMALHAEVVPTFRGHRLNAEGLALLAAAARAAAGFDEADPAAQTVQVLYEHRLLEAFGTQSGSQWHLDLHAYWQAQMRTYRLTAQGAPPAIREIMAEALPLACAAALEVAVQRQGPLMTALGEQAGRMEPSFYRDCPWFTTILERARDAPALLAVLPLIEPHARDTVLQVRARREQEDTQQGLRFFCQVVIVFMLSVAAYQGAHSLLTRIKELRRLDGIVAGMAFGSGRQGDNILNIASGDPALMTAIPTKLVVDAAYHRADPHLDTLTVTHQLEAATATEICTEALAVRDGHVVCELGKPAVGRHLFWVAVNGLKKGPYVLIIKNPAKSP